MSALSLARRAGVALALEQDGRITWRSSRPVGPNVLAHLRARREEIRAALAAAKAPVPATDAVGPIAEARALGWRVVIRPAGLLIDTRGQPSDPALMERLHAAMLADPPHDRQALRWPVAVLADPAEVVLRGELEQLEQEAGR